MLPALEQHPDENGRYDIGELEEYLTKHLHMRVGAVGKKAAYLVGAGACQAVSLLKKQVRDDEVDLWKSRKETKKSPPETEEGDEGIACGARTQSFREAIFAIAAVEIYDQGGFPTRIVPPKAAKTPSRTA